MVSVFGDREATKNLGERIRAERLRRNWTQAHVAALVGITNPTYRKIEGGDGSVEFRHVVRTLAVFGREDRLAELLPESGPELRLADLVAPQRVRASRPRNT